MTWRWPVMLGFISPALLLYGIFLLYPMVAGVSLSFTDSTGLGSAAFIGLQNYQRLITDPEFLNALKNAFCYALLVVVLQNALGLAMAIAAGNTPVIRNLLRVALFTPSMVAPLIVGFIWSYIYFPIGGGLNEFLKQIGLGSFQRAWLGDSNTALIAVALVNVWMYAGYSAAIYLANYLAISQELLDAAALDGARGWIKFWRVEWPLMAPSTTVNVVLTSIGTLRVFELPFILTKGGPAGASDVPSLLIYRSAFTANQFGYASAIGITLAIIIVVISSVLSSVLRAREADL